MQNLLLLHTERGEKAFHVLIRPTIPVYTLEVASNWMEPKDTCETKSYLGFE